jgi:hypothetical protein
MRRPPASIRPLRLAASLALLIGAGLGLAGCPVESDQPLGPADQAKEDSALYGVWYANENDSPAWFHIYRPNAADPGVIEVMIVSQDANGVGDSERYSGHLSEVDGLRFVNIRGPVTGDAPSGPYYLVNYRVAADGALELRLLREATAEAAIAADRLAGERTADGKPTDHVTDTPERIRAYVAATDPSLLFDDPIRLEPVRAKP